MTVRPAVLLLAVAVALPAAAQTPVPFEQVVADLRSPSVETRRQAVQSLAETGFPEAAVHLSRAALDDDDGVQASAVSGLLNLFVTQSAATRRRVALVFEVRRRTSPVDLFARVRRRSTRVRFLAMS